MDNNKSIYKKIVFIIALILTSFSFLMCSYNAYAEVPPEQMQKRLEKDNEKYETQLEELEEKYNNGEINVDKYEEQKEKLEQKIENNQNRIDNIEEQENGEHIGIDAIIDEFCNWILKSLLKVLLSFNDMVLNLTDSVLFPENAISIIASIYSNLYSLSTSIALSLIILMTLSKGFNTYILWKDGNPEENPFEVIVRHVFAIAMLLCFNELYSISASVVSEILTKINTAVQVSQGDYDSVLNNLTNRFGIVFVIIFFILYIVQLIKAMFNTIGKGIELLILRLGFPLACVSATSPHASTFHTVISSFIKAFLSVIVMKILISLSLGIMFTNPGIESFIWAIGTLFMVNKGSQLINQFVVPQQGGGGGMLGNAINRVGSEKISSFIGKFGKK